MGPFEANDQQIYCCERGAMVSRHGQTRTRRTAARIPRPRDRSSLPPRHTVHLPPPTAYLCPCTGPVYLHTVHLPAQPSSARQPARVAQLWPFNTAQHQLWCSSALVGGARSTTILEVRWTACLLRTCTRCGACIHVARLLPLLPYTRQTAARLTPHTGHVSFYSGLPHTRHGTPTRLCCARQPSTAIYSSNITGSSCSGRPSSSTKVWT